MPPVARKGLQVGAGGGVSFGDNDALYAGNGAIPEGRWSLAFDIRLFPGFKPKPNAIARLGCFIDATSIDDPNTTKQAFLGFGKNAEKSFVPNDTGTGIVPVPGGPTQTLNDQTNWAIFRQSLFDCGLPRGVWTDDISVLNGIHVHIQNVPEPESRKSMRSNAAKTGEVQEEEVTGSGTVPVVSEILDSGKPWESAPVKAARPAVKATAPAKAAPATKAAAASVEDDEDLQNAAVNGISAVLEANPNGLMRLQLRAQTFKAVSKAQGEETGQAVLKAFFESDEALGPLLDSLGFQVSGGKVSPQ